MNIFGVTAAQGSQGLQAAKLGGVESTHATGTAGQAKLAEVQDTVTISVDGVRAAESAADIRFDRVNAIKAAIADGSYETPEKLDAALDRLLDRLRG
jgi:negative regulator of flagellin synthesis FlgM